VSSRSSFQICQITQDKVAHPFLKQHEEAAKTAHEAALNHKQLESYHHDKVLENRHDYMRREHAAASMAHAEIRKKLQDIERYHRKRIDEINAGDKGHASVDHDEAKKIEASTTFSAQALKCAVDMDPRTSETRAAVRKLSDQAAKLRLFAKYYP